MSKRKSRICIRNIESTSQDNSTGSLCLNVESADDIEMETTPVDIQRLCRMCAQPCTVATSTNLLEPNATLTYQLLHNFGILIQPKDGMPHRICHLCTNELQHWDELKIKVKNAQDFLNTQFQQNMKRKLQKNEDSDLEVFDEDSDQDEEYIPPSKKKRKMTNKKVKNIVVHKKVNLNTLSFKCFVCDFKSDNFDIFTEHASSHEKKSYVQNVDSIIQNDESNIQNDVSNIQSDVSNIQYYDFDIQNDDFMIQNDDLEIQNDVSNILSDDFKIQTDECSNQNNEFNSENDNSNNQNDKFISFDNQIIKYPIQSWSREGIAKVFKNRKIYKLSPNFPYQCGLCPSKYNDSLNLAEHLQKHIKTCKHLKSLPCPYCKIIVRRISNLIEHIDNHIDNPSKKLFFNCKICDKHFVTSKNLKKHMEIHSDIKKYECPYCDMQYKHKSVLADHMEKHKLQAIDNANNEINSKLLSTKILPTCGVCLQFFNTYQQLYEHIKNDHVTIIESVYPCGNCTYRCRSLEAILLHIKDKHIENINNEIKFSCDICKKDFMDSKSFDLHNKIHKGKTIHDCPFCKIIFTELDELKSHVTRFHQNTIINEKKTRKIVPKPTIKRAMTTSLKPIAPKIDDDAVKVLYLSNNGDTFVINDNNELESNNILLNNDIEPNVIEIDMNDNTAVLNNDKQSFLSFFNDTGVENGYPCGLCNQRFSNAIDFLNHSENELIPLGHKQLPCGYCGCMFKNIKLLLKHTEDHIKYPTKKLSHQCQICLKKFYLKKNYNTHLRSHTEIKCFKCKLCDAAFKHKISWRVHYLNFHKDHEGDENDAFIDESYLIVEENENITLDTDIDNIATLVKNTEMDIQKVKREKVEHYSCDICNNRYFEHKELYGHYLEKHFNPSILKCDFCINTFQTPEELISHLENHSKIKKHFCPVCGRDFKIRSSMTDHIDLHSNERKYKCEQCIRCYRSRTSLTIHKKRDHGKGTELFMCEICSNTYTSKAQLKRHILSHNNVHLYKCSICDKSYTSNYRLVNHQYLHSGIKPYHCLKCNKGFICSKYWRIHMRNICNVPENDIVYFRPRFFDGKKVSS